MRAAEHVLRFLAKCGVQYLFGIPGGTVNPFYDAVQDIPEIDILMSRHEAAAAYKAASYAKHSGKIAVVMGSSGPGSTNLITGVASAMREGTPMLVLTGQIRSSKMGYGGAQESSPWTMDMVDAFKPFCKRSLMATSAAGLTDMVRQALWLANTPPCGPVHISIPMDVQMAEVGDPIPAAPKVAKMGGVSSLKLSEIFEFFYHRKGVILVGSGVKKARATIDFFRFAERIGWPVITTPAGKGAFPEDHKLSMGVYGLAGNQSAKDAVNASDRVLILGTSLGELATSNWSPALFTEKTVVQVDHNPASIGRHFQPDVALVADLTTFFNQLIPVLRPREWRVMQKAEDPSGDVMVQHLKGLAMSSPEDAILVSDIGEHMTWALRHWKTRGDDGFDINVNFGGMGSGIASAIGAKLARLDRPVICLTGDGCFAMHGSEILTAVQYKIPVVFVVINNYSYGMVRWGHYLQYNRFAEDFDYPYHDITRVASGMGAHVVKVRTPEDWMQIRLEEALSADRPTVIEVVVPSNGIPPMADRVRYLKGEEDA